jgi:hypothetical protein
VDGVLGGIVSIVAYGESAPGAVLAVAGAVGWAFSLFVGWATPAPFIDSMGRAAIAASGFSMLALVAGLAVVAASVVS